MNDLFARYAKSRPRKWSNKFLDANGKDWQRKGWKAVNEHVKRGGRCSYQRETRESFLGMDNITRRSGGVGKRESGCPETLDEPRVKWCLLRPINKSYGPRALMGTLNWRDWRWISFREFLLKYRNTHLKKNWMGIKTIYEVIIVTTDGNFCFQDEIFYFWHICNTTTFAIISAKSNFNRSSVNYKECNS